MSKARVLLVEDDGSLRLTQQLYLQKAGFEVTGVASGTEARQLLTQDKFDLVVTDLRLDAVDGLQVLNAAKHHGQETEVVVITGHGTVDSAVEAMRAGAFHYLTKPVDPDQLVLILRQALEHRRLRRQVAHLQAEVAQSSGFAAIIAASPQMQQVMARATQVAASEATVLIQGESGTGKELIARFIHHQGPRANAPFVAVNCGALAENLLESELFGHARGSFSGAVAPKAGLFETADGGTIFLDEISETSFNFQVKLLRVLEDGSMRRVGSTTEQRVDVRVIAATNRDLARLTQKGEFRRDLYYRLSVVPIEVPPLRQRPADIIPLAQHFIRRYCQRMGRKAARLSEEAAATLLAHKWPGNVRELENAIERALIFCGDPEITPADLSLERPLPPGVATVADVPDDDMRLQTMESNHLRRVLALCHWNQAEAARRLGIGYNTLWRKMKRFGIKRPRP